MLTWLQSIRHDEAIGKNAIIIAPGAAATLSADDMNKVADVIRSAAVFITRLEQPMQAAHRVLIIAREAGVLTIINPASSASAHYIPRVHYSS